MISNGIRSIVLSVVVLAILYLPGSVIDSKAASAVGKNSLSSRQQSNKSLYFASLKYGQYGIFSFISMNDTLTLNLCGSRLISEKSEDLTRNTTRAASIGLTACQGRCNCQRHFIASVIYAPNRVSEIWAFYFGTKAAKHNGNSEKTALRVPAWQGSAGKTA